MVWAPDLEPVVLDVREPRHPHDGAVGDARRDELAPRPLGHREHRRLDQGAQLGGLVVDEQRSHRLSVIAGDLDDVAVVAMLAGGSLRLGGEVAGHPRRGGLGQIPAEVAIDVVDDRHRIAHELVVAAVRGAPRPRRAGPVAIDQGIQRAGVQLGVVPADLVRIDVITVRRAHRGYQAGDRGQHRKRVAVGERDPGVGIGVHEGVEGVEVDG